MELFNYKKLIFLNKLSNLISEDMIDFNSFAYQIIKIDKKSLDNVSVYLSYCQVEEYIFENLPSPTCRSIFKIEVVFLHFIYL